MAKTRTFNGHLEAAALSLDTETNSKAVVPITHLETKTWENKVQVKKYRSYPKIHSDIVKALSFAITLSEHIKYLNILSTLYTACRFINYYYRGKITEYGTPGDTNKTDRMC